MLNPLQNEVEILRKKASDLEAKLADITQALQESERLRKEKDADFDRLTLSYMQAMRDRYGRKTERFVDDENPNLPLFPVTIDSVEFPSDPEDIEDIRHTPKKRGKRRPLDPAGIPSREVILPVAPENRVCDCCGKEKDVIGYACSSRLHFKPVEFEMITEKREKMACRKGCSGQMVTATLPLRILPKSRASESLIAYICVSKVLDRQPLYHLEKSIEQRYDWKIGRNIMSRWMIMVADNLQPLVNLMKDQIEGYDIAAIDATSFQVLNEPNRNPELKSYAHCIRGGPPDKSVILYEYNAYTQKDYVDETLAFFKGTLHCDASPVFNKIGSNDGVTLSYCHAHARRKFEQIQKAAKKGKAQLATEAMRIYRQLYDIERYATDTTLSPADRLALRQEQSRPILDQFHQWLTVNQANTLPKSPIGLAIAYTLKHWDGLLVYLTDGRVEIDNNATERDIKPFVIARKNFLFACTPQGADSLGVHFSLILTARLHGLDPIHYYTEMLKRLPYCMTISDYEALLRKRSTNHTPSAGGEKKGRVSQVGVVGCSMAC